MVLRSFAMISHPGQTLLLLVCQDRNESSRHLSCFCAKTSFRSWNESVRRASASADSRKVEKLSSLHFHLWKLRPVSDCSSSVQAESCQRIWRVCFCTPSVRFGQTRWRVTRQILSDSASSHSSYGVILHGYTRTGSLWGLIEGGTGVQAEPWPHWMLAVERCWVDPLNSCSVVNGDPSRCSFKAPLQWKACF